MSRSRLIPLLLAGTISLALAACGGDDKPTTTTQASVPTTTAATTATTTAPTTTTAPSASTTTTTPTTTESTETSTAPTTTSNALSNLKQYTKGGKPANAQDTKDVRAALRAFGEAITKRDAKGICDRTVGLDKLLQSAGKGATCESLFKNSGSTSGPSKKEMAQIDSANVTIKGDHASLDISAGTPLPLRKVDGEWKIDYGAITAAPQAAK